MPLITGFKETTLINAFVLNSLATSLIIVVSLYIDDTNKTKKFFLTFLAAMLIYVLLYIIFDYGEGLLI